MFKLGLPELLVILVIVFFLFGAKRLPEMGKGIGEAIKGFKSSMKERRRKKITRRTYTEEGTGCVVPVPFLFSR